MTPNLIPIMNLFTALIPFLLMSAAFYQLAVINITIPVASESGETDVAKDEDKITLNLRIKEDAFDLSASSATLGPDILKTLKASVPRPKAEGDALMAIFAQLSEAAYQIKKDYTASDTVVVVPDSEIPYEVIVDAMDAVRTTTVERDGSKHRIRLFDRVVLSSMIK